MSNSLKSNIWKFTIASVANKRIFVAILGAYYLTIEGVTPQIIGTIALCGNLASFIFEIPSGYVSDKIGHKQALVISRISMLLSSLCFFFAENISFLILATIVMSIGMAFNSGTGSAFMHETLKGLGRSDDYPSVMGKISSIGFAVPIALTVLVPFLVSVSYKIPFLIMALVDIVGLIAVYALVIPPVEQEDIEEIQASNVMTVMREAYQLTYFTIALFSGLMSALLLSVSNFRAPFQVELGIPVMWFGVFIGIGRGLASVMLAYSGRFEKRFTLTSFYRFQYLLYVFLIICLGLTRNAYLVITLFIITSAFHWGLSKIDEGYQLKVIGKSKFKATLLSIGSQIDNVLAAGFGFFLGWIIERTSYSSGFLYVGSTAGVLLTLVYVRISRVYTHM
jgi:MFS family permease